MFFVVVVSLTDSFFFCVCVCEFLLLLLSPFHRNAGNPPPAFTAVNKAPQSLARPSPPNASISQNTTSPRAISMAWDEPDLSGLLRSSPRSRLSLQEAPRLFFK